MAHLINKAILAFVAISIALNGYAQSSSSESANPMDGLIFIFGASGIVAACRRANGVWPITKSDIEACATTEEARNYVNIFCALDVEPSSEHEAVLKMGFPYRKDNSDHCTEPLSLSINVEGEKNIIGFPGPSDSQPKHPPNEETIRQLEALKSMMKEDMERELDKASSDK